MATNYSSNLYSSQPQNFTPYSPVQTSSSQVATPVSANFSPSSGGAAYVPAPAPRPTQNYTPYDSNFTTNDGNANTAPSNNTNTGSNPFDIQPQGPSQEEIDAQFAPIFDVLNQAEGNLRGQQPGLIAEAEAQAAASRGLLESGRESQNELLGKQENRVQRTGQSQTAEQRRTLQELTQANQQRFGGASSAGLAASELQGREFQRNRFQIQQTVQEGLQQINQRRQDVEREFQNGVQQLQVNTQRAINDLNRRFQDKLLEINARRGETENSRQQARLGALQDLRNQAYQINVAKAQFEADLRNQAQQNLSTLNTTQEQLMQYGQQGVQAGDNVAGAQYSGIPSVTGGQSGQGTGISNAVGNISTNRNNEDLYTGQIFGGREQLPNGIFDATGQQIGSSPYFTQTR